MAVLLIYCDATAEIGSGHVQRTSTLAGALKQTGWEVVFVTGNMLPQWKENLVQRAFAIRDLDGKGAIADQLISIAREESAEGILVDHYGFTSEDFAKLGASGLKVAMIDDMADRDLRSVGWMLNQNLGAETLDPVWGPECRVLLGPEFALLRAQFHEKRHEFQRRFSEEDRKILVTLGGGDTAELCSEILTALRGVEKDLEIRCILGSGESLPNSVLAGQRHSIEVLGRVEQMAEQMIWADISINAGGSTCWELCCLGTPMVIVVRSSDQSLIAKELERKGCALAIHEWRAGAAEFLAESISRLLDRPEERKEMSIKSQVFVDGRGAQRAAESLAGFLMVRAT